jgi:hypothetical protein
MIPSKVSDLCTAGAGCLFGVSLASADHVVSIIAGALTAVAAAVSLYGAWTRRQK